MTYSGPNTRLSTVGPLSGPPSVYGIGTLDGNYTVATTDMLQSATVQASNPVPYTVPFAVADRRFPPAVTIAQVNDLSWRVVNQTSSGTANAEFDLISFAALDTRYTTIATSYVQPSVTPGSGYTHDYLVSAISSAWTGNAVPVTGSGRYVGKMFGVVIVPGHAYDMTADVTVTVDFGTRGAAGVINGYAVFDRDTGNPVATPAGMAGLGIDFAASLFGDGFNERVTTSGTAVGRVQARIAGPNAEEFGGSYHAVNSDFAMVGAFVAKR